MKFRLSTFLLAIALIAVLVGWSIERRYYASRLVDETEREGAISSTLSTALFTNMIYYQMDNLSEAEFARRREGQLINNVVFLYLHRDNAVDRTILKTSNYTQRKAQTTALLREAGKSLDLLGVVSTADFASLIRNHGFTEDWEDGLLDSNGNLEDQLLEFVNNCLLYHEHQNLAFTNNRTKDQTLTMAECEIKLYDANILNDSRSVGLQVLLEQLPDDPDGRKDALLKKLNTL